MGYEPRKRSQFTVINDIVNDIVNDKKGQNIVNDSSAHKPDRLLVSFDSVWHYLWV